MMARRLNYTKRPLSATGGFMNHPILTSALLCLVALGGLVEQAAAQEQVPRGIVNIAPDLYRVQNNNHYTVFLVTPDGIIMSDPINRDFSMWLKGELQRRFNRPVRYVLYTHHDWDHASGGAVWADTAQFIAHDNFPETLTLPAGNLPLPGNARKMDANGNGRVERSEAAGGNLAANFDLTDANRDGALSGAELARGALNDVHAPTMTFTDRHTVTLGGKTAVMVYIGQAHATDSSVIYFPKERVVFSADVMQVKRLPQALGPTIGLWIDALKTIESLDFDIAATGHALAGTKADVIALREYVEELATGVAAGVAAGRSVKEIQQSLRFDKYKAWERGDVQPPLHIAQVYATMRGSR
jgi:glyoxylase-like metal-dependent hydrolase (beta-lactamase superfamily II)